MEVARITAKRPARRPDEASRLELREAGLDGLARLVHYLDVGGPAVAEAAGFEAVFAGLHDEAPDDNALLAATSPVLDALYQHFYGGLSHARRRQ